MVKTYPVLPICPASQRQIVLATRVGVR
jgi:hypothetical protein